MSNKKGTRLAGKTIVITGASSGAGRAAALEGAKGGAHLVVAARNEAALQALAEECEALDAQVLVVPTDVSDAKAVIDLAKAAHAWKGKIDAWINNAAVLAAGPFEETPLEVHHQVIQTNLIGYVNGTYAVLPIFKEQGNGVLINNISVGGWFPAPYATAYSASKFGIRGFSDALKGELTGYPHIHVCDLAPAFLDTPGIQHTANYTGVALRPAPPLTDPQRLARVMMRRILNPRPVTDIGIVSPFIKLSYTLFPGLSRLIAGAAVRAYMKAADPMPEYPGNVFQFAEYGTSVHGGWSQPASREKKGLLALGALAGVALTLLLRKTSP